MNVHVQVSDDPCARIVELEAQARNTQIALDGVAQGVCFFDRDNRLIAANRSFAAIHRLAPKALRPGAALGEVAEAFQAAGTCPMAVDDYVAYCRAIRARGEPRVWCVTLADGRILRVRQEPTPDGGWAAIHTDVTEAREIRRLREACETLQALIDRVPGHLWVKDCDSRFVFANQAAATDLGRGAVADLVGLSDFDFRAPAAATERRRLELGVILSGEPIVDRRETLVAASGAIKQFRSTTTTLRDAGGRIAGLVGVEIDAAAVKATEAFADELDILDMVASGAPAGATLGALLGFIEAHSSGVVASALRLDPGGERLRYAARSNLPQDSPGGDRGSAPRLRRARVRRRGGATDADRQRRRRRRSRLGRSRRRGRGERLRRLLGDADPGQERRAAGRVRRLRARSAGAEPGRGAARANCQPSGGDRDRARAFRRRPRARQADAVGAIGDRADANQ